MSGLRVDPLAKSLFSQLRTRSAADRRLVFLALQRRLEPPGATQRQARVLAVLRQCARDCGHAPSRREWDAWRAAQPCPAELPSATAIRNAFGGSWSRARAAAGGVPAPDVLALRLTAQGGRYTDEEMLAALHSAAPRGDVGALTFEAYVRWARSQQPSDGSPRVPRSGKPFRRRWGTWEAAILAAHLAHENRGVAPVRSRAWGRAYSRDALVEALRVAARALDCDDDFAVSYCKYDEWATSDRVRADRSALPRAATIARAFGTWAEALLASGLLDPDQLRRRAARTGSGQSDDGLAGWLGEAWDELGSPPTRDQYSRWRQQRIAAGAPGRAVPPSDATLRVRLGGWEQALRLTGRTPAA